MHQEIGGFLRTKFQRVLAYLGLVDQEKAARGERIPGKGEERKGNRVEKS